MKLNTKRTVLVGFAFLSICAFWQMYDNLVPKILTETFGIGESISGVIMASDNVLALFLLPIFGGISDKCTSKLGRRRPFILWGTLAAVVLMMALPQLDLLSWVLMIMMVITTLYSGIEYFIDNWNCLWDK